MKIKDVIKETGLTDRAIRLYIENGLVTPSFSESYTGRKSIEFSKSDVKELSNIATLRKAGFSIGEIKLLNSDSDSCRKALEDFIEKTAKKIESDKTILEKLQAVSVKEAVTPNDICESLNSVTSEKSVPVSDTELTFFEKAEKYFFRILGIIGLLYIFGSLLYVIYICKFNFSYIYPAVLAFDYIFFIKLTIVLFVLISSIYLLLSYHKITIFKKRKKHLIISSALSAVSILLCIPFFFFTISSVFTPNACSKTTSPKNYMVLDETSDYEEIKYFFPKEIDSYATNHHSSNDLLLNLPDTYPESTKYYYKYFSEGFGGDTFTEVIAEWKPLQKYEENDDFFDNYNECIKKYTALEYDNTALVGTKGNWRCYYYDDTSEENFEKRYFYRIFAYNDETKTLRFIYAKRDIKDPIDSAKEIVPYYINLEW